MKKPQYTHGFVDRHGKARCYFRRRGHKQVPLPGLPWSPEFMAAYEQAASGIAAVPLGAKLIKAGSVKALINTYLHSVTFADLAKETQRTRRNVLIRFEREHGDKRMVLLKREH